MLAAEGGLKGLGDGVGLETEIEEASAGDFNFLAPLADVEPRHDIGGELARVHLAHLGDGH